MALSCAVEKRSFVGQHKDHYTVVSKHNTTSALLISISVFIHAIAKYDCTICILFIILSSDLW